MIWRDLRQGTLDLIWSQTEDPTWTTAYIEDQRPAVVIEEIVERALMSRPAPFLRPGWDAGREQSPPGR